MWDTKAALSGCTGGFAPLVGSAEPAGDRESPRSLGVLSSGRQLPVFLPREIARALGWEQGLLRCLGLPAPLAGTPRLLVQQSSNSTAEKGPSR